jgi:AcrR family transcriptional regulator
MTAEDTRSAIRGVALELFAMHGFVNTSLREIAERLGMTKAALYYHYPSKQALLLAIIEPLISEWKAVADKTATLEHTPEHVHRVLDECLSVLLRHRAIAGMFARDAPAIFEAIGRMYENLLDIHQRLHTWLAGPSPTNAELVRAMAATEVLGTALGWSPALRETSDEEMRAVLLDAASDVLRLRDRTLCPKGHLRDADRPDGHLQGI